MPKTMQQIDHDAWEEGYGRESGVVNAEINLLELQHMYEAIARRKAAEEAARKAKEETKEEPESTTNNEE